MLLIIITHGNVIIITVTNARVGEVPEGILQLQVNGH